MKKSNIKNMDINYLSKIGFQKEQISFIYDLIHRAIEEQLYMKNHFPYHDITHIERVLCYCTWILNMKINKGELLKILIFYFIPLYIMIVVGA